MIRSKIGLYRVAARLPCRRYLGSVRVARYQDDHIRLMHVDQIVRSSSIASLISEQPCRHSRIYMVGLEVN